MERLGETQTLRFAKFQEVIWEKDKRSSVVHETIRTLLNQFIFFFHQKILSVQESKPTKTNQQNHKQAYKKQQRQQRFAQKTSERMKICYFAL